MAKLDFPCTVCGTPARPDRINGACNDEGCLICEQDHVHTEACRRKTCESCFRRCGRCGQIFCQYHVEYRLLMIQQKPHEKLLCKLCRMVLLV